MTSAEPILAIEGLEVAYGAVTAVDGLSLEVRANQVVALLGANGAGKTSTVRAICGAIPARAGTVRFEGRLVNRRRPDRLARSGLVMVPEGRKIIAPLSVQDNLLLGGYTRGSKRALSQALDEVYELYPILSKRRDVPGGLLSGGEQQLLALARALMSRPKIILLDEPTMGLAPVMVGAVMERISEVAAMGVSILMIEQNAMAAMPRCSWVYVIELGRIVFSGSPQEAMSNLAIVEAYLGETGMKPV